MRGGGFVELWISLWPLYYLGGMMRLLIGIRKMYVQIQCMNGKLDFDITPLLLLLNVTYSSINFLKIKI